jgi:hypothetical protein
MKRLRVALGALVLVVGGGLIGALVFRGGSGSSSTTTTTTTTTVEVVNGSRPAAMKPARMPTLLEGGRDPYSLLLADAIPVDAALMSANYVTRYPQQLVVTWNRLHLTRNGDAAIWQRRGVAIWQIDRDNAASWHRVYTREVVIDNTTYVSAFDVTLGDATGDRRPEILILFAIDGSAGGGTYHLFANVQEGFREVFVKPLSLDQGTISFGHHALLVRQGRGYYGQGAHCCFRRVEETWLRWDGGRMATVKRVVRKNRRGWPPG